MSDRSPFLDIDSHGEIVAIDVERDLDVLRVQIRTGWIMKAADLAACEDEASNGAGIARSAFEPIANVDCAQFVFIGPLDAIIAYGDEGDPIKQTRGNGVDRRLCGDQRAA